MIKLKATGNHSYLSDKILTVKNSKIKILGVEKDIARRSWRTKFVA